MTRSRIASKLLSETPPELRQKVRAMSDELVRRHKEVEAIELTEDEIRYALHQAKIAKWNRERNAEYWEEQERQTIKAKQI